MTHGGGSTSYLHPDDPRPQTITIEETSVVQEVVLAFDHAKLTAVGEEAAALRDELARRPDETDDEHQRRVLDALMRRRR